MASVRLENVKKVYDGGVVAVHNVTLDVKDKEFVVLVGPSGCGKSTTLRMIAGLEEVSGGDIYIGDQRVNDVAPKDRDIAMVFQNYALYPHMSVYENMSFGLKLRNMPKDEIDSRVKEAADVLGIEALLDRKPKALSGGQRQRVAVGRAIVRKPKVFLFDEPLSNLDANLRVQMRTEISKLHHRLGTTMVYVTHDQTEAMTMGDKIVLMKDGHVQQIDAPLEIYNRPANKFVGGFIGSPSMNFLVGGFETGRGFSFQEQGGGVRFGVPEKARRTLKSFTRKSIIVGIRPEHILHKSQGTTAGLKSVQKVKVEVVEPMGNEIYVYFTTKTGGALYVARINSSEEPEVGKATDLVFDVSKAHYFDAETEKVIDL